MTFVQLADLPWLNAVLNGCSAVCLLSGYFSIRHLKVRLHRFFMVAALLFSTLFLVSYLTYHAHVGSVHFTGTGIARIIYFTVLGSHTILAAAVPFLVAVTLYLVLRAKYNRHRKIARWTLPIWLYVSVTGVVIYVMLYQLFPAI